MLFLLTSIHGQKFDSTAKSYKINKRRKISLKKNSEIPQVFEDKKVDDTVPQNKTCTFASNFVNPPDEISMK